MWNVLVELMKVNILASYYGLKEEKSGPVLSHLILV